MGLFLTTNGPPQQSNLWVVLLSLEGNQWFGFRRQGCEDVYGPQMSKAKVENGLSVSSNVN